MIQAKKIFPTLHVIDDLWLLTHDELNELPEHIQFVNIFGKTVSKQTKNLASFLYQNLYTEAGLTLELARKQNIEEFFMLGILRS